MERAPAPNFLVVQNEVVAVLHAARLTVHDDDPL